MAAEQGRARPVVLTEDGAVDVVEAIARHEPVSTGGAGETLGTTERDGGGGVRIAMLDLPAECIRHSERGLYRFAGRVAMRVVSKGVTSMRVLTLRW